ncbi:MAG: replication-relaxation family protein [Defluviitaleaceae bacterium]|nr:replication-relaxation family protein [Defluviitaleaceae bacterium]
MVIVERDLEILRLVYRFKFCFGRHVSKLIGFTGMRACDRRLKALTDGGYLARKKYLYGLPYLYTLTHKGRILIGANKRENKIRLEQINHDAQVLDILIHLKAIYGFSLNDIKSERELHIKDGFGTRKHHPDFLFEHHGKKYAVEVELTLKAKTNLEKNVRDNYLNYDQQIWVTGDNKIFGLLKNFAEEYANMEIISIEKLEEIKC